MSSFSRLYSVAAPLAALALATCLALPGRSESAEISITWVGHATFELRSPGGTTILIDPFIGQNPSVPEPMKDLKRYKPDVILLSHSHFDHVADAEAIAKQSGAKVIGAFEQVNAMELPQEQQLGGNVGGTFTVGDVSVHIVPAVHSSDPGGRPLGFVIGFEDGRTVYHTGDTWIFGDMELIQEIYSPNVVLLQCGGGPYNEDPATAALAIRKYFAPELIIPMHYGTWPVLATEADVRKAFADDSRVRVLKPGETTKF